MLVAEMTDRDQHEKHNERKSRPCHQQYGNCHEQYRKQSVDARDSRLDPLNELDVLEDDQPREVSENGATDPQAAPRHGLTVSLCEMRCQDEMHDKRVGTPAHDQDG